MKLLFVLCDINRKGRRGEGQVEEKEPMKQKRIQQTPRKRKRKNLKWRKKYIILNID